MKKYFISLSALVLANFFFGCEKDDICEAGTPTTPRMIVEFYDNLNPNTTKTISNVGIAADGFTNGILFSNVSKIEVPLKTNADLVTYSFVLDAQNTNVLLRNEDQITINYSRNNVYISRACGFKTVFTLNKTNAITQNVDTDKWIKEILIKQNNILNEDEIHVKIFF
jgi:Family of unknown function (DUF6452)